MSSLVVAACAPTSTSEETPPAARLHAPLLEPCNNPANRDYNKPSCLGLAMGPLNRAASALCRGAQDIVMRDTAKTIHSLKMALALVLAFLLVLMRVPYEQLGSHAIWAIMTVIVVFEFTIGATLSKGLNRGAGTLLAGVLAIGVSEVAGMNQGFGHPILIGFSVFIIGGVVTFAKLWPSMKLYEFGLRTFLVTFCLIMVAEYSGGDPLTIAIDRFLVILLGATIGISVNVFVLPCWAGHDLHRTIVANFSSIADSLEACVNEYLQGTTFERVPSKFFMGQAVDDPVYNGYRSALISATKEESLAGFASWEPPHGRFKVVKYPWHLYVKVGAVLRHCAYSVVALHGSLLSAIQAPTYVRKMFEKEFHAVGVECAVVLRKMGRQIEDMHKGNRATLFQGVERAVHELQQSLYFHSYLLVRRGYLEEKGENVVVSVISEVARTLDIDDCISQAHSSNNLELNYVHQGFFNLSKKCLRRMRSWPLRPRDELDFVKDVSFKQRVRVLESASALSLGTFATLLMEVALRLDYVVEAVEELGELANFVDFKNEKDTDIKIDMKGHHCAKA